MSDTRGTAQKHQFNCIQLVSVARCFDTAVNRRSQLNGIENDNQKLHKF